MYIRVSNTQTESDYSFLRERTAERTRSCTPVTLSTSKVKTMWKTMPNLLGGMTRVYTIRSASEKRSIANTS